MAVTIEQDLKEYLTKLDQRFDEINQRFDKIDQRFDKVDQKLEKIQEDGIDLKVGQARLEEKMNGLGQRLDNQEFLNRGVVIGLLVALLGGLAKIFGLVGNP